MAREIKKLGGSVSAVYGDTVRAEIHRSSTRADQAGVANAIPQRSRIRKAGTRVTRCVHLEMHRTTHRAIEKCHPRTGMIHHEQATRSARERIVCRANVRWAG